jgi:hypothetical protein
MKQVWYIPAADNFLIYWTELENSKIISFVQAKHLESGADLIETCYGSLIETFKDLGFHYCGDL